MKKFHVILLTGCTTLLVFYVVFATNQKINYSIVGNFFNKNYLSSQTSPGKELNQPQYKPDDLLNLLIDGKMNESEWKKAQVINNFYSSERNVDNGVEVKIISDKENIYLFWKVEDTVPVTANIFKNDSALAGDDYVQVNLKPILPDSIKYGRDYSFSVAINPNGAIWDAYFDPYHIGYYFTDWNSNTKLKSIKNTDGFTVEMAIPYSDLDIYADPGWK